MCLGGSSGKYVGRLPSVVGIVAVALASSSEESSSGEGGRDVDFRSSMGRVFSPAFFPKLRSERGIGHIVEHRPFCRLVVTFLTRYSSLGAKSKSPHAMRTSEAITLARFARFAYSCARWNSCCTTMAR